MTQTPQVASLRQIAQAVADQIRDELDMVIVGVQVEPRRVFQPTLPCIDIYPADPFLEQTGMGHESREATWIIRARVATVDNDAGQDLLLDLLDPRSDESLIAALAADTTFGGVVAASTVEDSPTGYVLHKDVESLPAYMGAEWRLRVVL